MRDILITLGLCSVVFLSGGFLVVAFYINRQMTKEERQQSDPD